VLQLHELGSISIATRDAVTSSRAELAEAAAPGSELDAIVWEELEDRARGDSRWSITFGVLMAIAAVIASVGVLVDSPVLIIGAMIAGTIALTRGRQETLAGVLASVLTLAVHDRSERRKVRAGAR
jgi:hypothetical protein